LTVEVLDRTVRYSTVLGKERVLASLTEIHARYVASVDMPAAA
jgi:hypothetical protein